MEQCSQSHWHGTFNLLFGSATDRADSSASRSARISTRGTHLKRMAMETPSRKNWPDSRLDRTPFFQISKVMAAILRAKVRRVPKSGPRRSCASHAQPNQPSLSIQTVYSNRLTNGTNMLSCGVYVWAIAPTARLGDSAKSLIFQAHRKLSLSPFISDRYGHPKKAFRMSMIRNHTGGGAINQITSAQGKMVPTLNSKDPR